MQSKAEELERCVAAKNDKIAHRDNVLHSVLGKLRKRDTELRIAHSELRQRDARVTPPASTATPSRKKSRKKGSKHKGISNATTLRAEAAQAADATATEHARLERTISEQARTITAMQVEVESAMHLAGKTAGMQLRSAGGSCGLNAMEICPLALHYHAKMSCVLWLSLCRPSGNSCCVFG